MLIEDWVKHIDCVNLKDLGEPGDHIYASLACHFGLVERVQVYTNKLPYNNDNEKDSN